MNYYKRHLGDFAKDTGHLSMMEQGAYNLLLDRYYATERPIPDKDAHKVTRANTKPEREALAAVLGEFFKRDGDVWRHSYADRVIADAAEKAEASRNNGSKGGRPSNASKVPRGTEPNGNPSGSSQETQQVNHGLSKKTLATTPLSNNQEKTKTPRGASALAGFDAFWLRYPKKIAKGAAEKTWAKLRPDEVLQAAILQAIDAQAASPAWLKDAGQFIPNPATWLNQRRWEDQATPASSQAAQINTDGLWANFRTCNASGSTSEHAEVNHAAKMLGGWTRLGETSSFGISQLRKAFDDAVRSYRAAQ